MFCFYVLPTTVVHGETLCAMDEAQQQQLYNYGMVRI